jgi:hypothetical protein
MVRATQELWTLRGGSYSDKRSLLDRIFHQLEDDRNSFIKRWRTLADYICPTRPRWTSSDRNRGDRSNSKIINSTATQAVEIAKAGMLAGMASPARPWFELTTGERRIDEQPAVTRWLDATRNIALSVLGRSNFYQCLDAVFESELIFGPGTLMMLEDPKTIINCHTFPIGSYSIGQDASGRINAFAREFTMTVEQLVGRFGKERVSSIVRDSYEQQRYTEAHEVKHLIMANLDHEAGRIGPAGMPWAEWYWEEANVGETQRDPETQGFLRESGYQEFPVFTARWAKNDDDVWPTSSPGMVSLGDIKQLQSMERKLANALAKLVDPPLVGPTSLKNKTVSLLSGGMTYSDTGPTQGGLRSIHEIRLPFQEVQLKMQEIQERIELAFKVPMFLMLLGDARGTPPTAEEVRAREREKLSVLGPILERHSIDLFDPAIDRLLAILMRRSRPAWALGQDGLLPRPPRVILDAEILPRYVSEVAAAQRMVGISGLERHVGFVGQVATVAPEALDVLNTDNVILEHADMTGVSPKISNSPGQVATIRKNRAAAQAATQMSETVPDMARAARDVAQAEEIGGSVAKALAGAV